MTIFQVLSNLNHNGHLYIKGAFFEAEESEFKALVTDGVLRVMEGANSMAHAVEIAADEVAQAAKIAEESALAQPENTWGPKPELPPAPEAAPENTENKELAPGAVGQGDQPPAGAGDNL